MKTTFKLLGRVLILERPRRIHANNRNIQTRSDPSPSPSWRSDRDSDLCEQMAKLQESLIKAQEKPTKKHSWFRERIVSAGNKTADDYIRRMAWVLAFATVTAVISVCVKDEQQDSFMKSIDDFVKNRRILKGLKEKVLWESLEEVAAKKKENNFLKETVLKNYELTEENGQMKAEFEAYKNDCRKEKIESENYIQFLETESVFNKLIRGFRTFLPHSLVMYPKMAKEEVGKSK